MGYERAKAALSLRPADKICQVEWLGGLSDESIRALTGLEPYKHRRSLPQALLYCWQLPRLFYKCLGWVNP